MSSEQALGAFYDALLDDDAEQLYDRAPCGYLSVTPDGLIIKVNQTFLNLTGFERTDLVRQRSFVDLLTAGGRIYHETHYAPMLRMQGMAREIALDIVRADGSRLPVLVNAVLDRDHAGEPRVVRIAVFDATERREYERELLRAKRRAEESEARARRLAQTLQQTLIPPTPPAIPGLEVAAAYRPAGTGAEVGGDFYDVFQVGPGDWVATIGDVCGKGTDAAVVTALVRYTIRAAAVRLGRSSDVLHNVNEVLLRNDSDRFCTVSLLRLRHDDAGWQVSMCSAGHPLPARTSPSGSVELVGRPGSLLGVFDHPALHDDEVHLGPGEGLLVYTDGVTEGRRGDAMFGEERMLASVGRHSADPSALVEGLLGDVLAFQGDDARDDIALLAVQVPQ